jgi:S1-C subfamily serine protease
MSSGRSSCEGRPATPRLALVLLAMALLLPARAAPAQSPIPPPPDDILGEPGASPGRRPPPEPPAPKRAVCPRCGYRCSAAWNYCIACGWDLRRLVGEAEESRLQAIARSTVGVTVGGRPNRHATAFRFGGPNLLLTHARVLVGADATNVRVRSHNNREYIATVVGHDRASGIGLLKADIPDMPAPEVAPAAPGVTEPSWAVCYPVVYEFDLVRMMPVSLHRGDVTAAGQTGTYLVSFENLLRTDHAIEEGCLGGPLVDSRGRLAGMILGGPENGITFALPLEGIRAVVDTLVRGDFPKRPFFGMGLVTPDERRRAKFGLTPGESRPLVAYLIRGSPAARAGVRPGDLLLAVGAERADTARDAGARLLAVAPDESGVPLTLERGGAEHRVTVQPVERPRRFLLDPIDEIQESLEANLEDFAGGDGRQAGLRVTDLVRGGRGEKARFRSGDVIVAVDDKSVRSLAAFDELVRTKFKEVFADGTPGARRRPWFYRLVLRVRTEEQEKVTRGYVNLFPDILSPPVY